MAVRYVAAIFDFLKNELRNFRIHNLAADPSSPAEGQAYWHTGNKKLRIHDGTNFIDVGSGGGDVAGPASAVDGQVVLFDSTTGKLIRAATSNGLAKLTGGVLSAAVAGTDYTTSSSTESFTNKTFDANGSGNTLSNVETGDFAAGVLNTSTSLTGATNTQLPSALAVKTYADNLLASNDAMLFKGGIDASANPNYPAADAGHTYKITVAGRIGGASGPLVAVGDTIYCTADGTSAGNHATVGAGWVIVQANVDAATTSTQGLVTLATATEAEAKTDAAKAVTAAALANFAVKKTGSIGNGAATSFAITHNLATTAVLVEVFKASTGQTWDVDVVRTSSNVVTVEFAGITPSSNEFTYVITG